MLEKQWNVNCQDFRQGRAKGTLTLSVASRCWIHFRFSCVCVYSDSEEKNRSWYKVQASFEHLQLVPLLPVYWDHRVHYYAQLRVLKEKVFFRQLQVLLSILEVRRQKLFFLRIMVAVWFLNVCASVFECMVATPRLFFLQLPITFHSLVRGSLSFQRLGWFGRGLQEKWLEWRQIPFLS